MKGVCFMSDELYPTVKAWLVRARNDLATAEFLIEGRADLLDTAVYHCQQAGEKALKAWLVSQNMPVQKTHDLGLLVQRAAATHEAFGTLRSDADFLTPLATAFRYPADDEAHMPTPVQADQALASARRIYSLVLAALPSDTHPN